MNAITPHKQCLLFSYNYIIIVDSGVKFKIITQDVKIYKTVYVL